MSAPQFTHPSSGISLFFPFNNVLLGLGGQRRRERQGDVTSLHYIHLSYRFIIRPILPFLFYFIPRIRIGGPWSLALSPEEAPSVFCHAVVGDKSGLHHAAQNLRRWGPNCLLLGPYSGRLLGPPQCACQASTFGPWRVRQALHVAEVGKGKESKRGRKIAQRQWMESDISEPKQLGLHT